MSGRSRGLVRAPVLVVLRLLWYQPHQGAEELVGGAAGTGENPPILHTLPPVLSHWKEQMQMDRKHNTQNTPPRFLGARAELKLGSSWGLTFSLVQTTSVARRAW